MGANLLCVQPLIQTRYVDPESLMHVRWFAAEMLRLANHHLLRLLHLLCLLHLLLCPCHSSCKASFQLR